MEMTYASIDVEGKGEKKNLIPNLAELAEKQISFSNTGGHGGILQMPMTGWTIAGLLTSISGVPYILPAKDNNAGKHINFLPGLVCLGDILKSNGYKNYFMCGSDAAFAGRDLLFKTHGDYEIYDLIEARKEGIIDEKYHNGFWGMEDSLLYEYAKGKLTKISENSQPFNFTILTVDIHHPEGYACSKCPQIYSQRYANVISCADKQIYEFLNWIKKQKWYEDTVIIITGDHLSMSKVPFISVEDRTIYNCFINTQYKKTDIKEKRRNLWMADIFPTILGALGVTIEGNQLGLGVNLFSEKETLAEKFGIEKLYDELKKDSDFYLRKVRTIKGSSDINRFH